MVQARGDQAMGFSHAKTTHHFALRSDGGSIFAEAVDGSDGASRDAVRSHMSHIASAFSNGDFAMPMFIHGRTPPGVDTMKRLKDRITYRAEETEKGGRVAIKTTDPEALRAVHAFLTFQIEDHHTGDTTTVLPTARGVPSPAWLDWRRKQSVV
jgi:hypothetical protein